MLDMVLSAITEALAAHEADAATVEVVREDPVGLWRLEVTPRAAGAAPLSVIGAEASDGDEVTLTFGETHFYIGGEPGEVAGCVRQSCDAVFWGRIEEAGLRGVSRARLTLPSGEVWTVGHVGWPVRWHRRRRTYAPYSPTLGD